MWALAIAAVVFSIILPLFMGPLLDRTVGGSALTYKLEYFAINNVGLIPTFLIFAAFVFIVVYALVQNKGKDTGPYVCGMYDYNTTLSCPYFETYVPSNKAMRVAEVFGLITMVAACAVSFMIAFKGGF
jgi:hypothetical protein